MASNIFLISPLDLFLSTLHHYQPQRDIDPLLQTTFSWPLFEHGSTQNQASYLAVFQKFWHEVVFPPYK